MTKLEMECLLKEKKLTGLTVSVSKKNGHIILMKPYFYRMGMTSEKLKNKVMDVLSDKFYVIDYYDKFVPFRGGASVKAQSHFGVVLKEVEEPVEHCPSCEEETESFCGCCGADVRTGHYTCCKLAEF